MVPGPDRRSGIRPLPAGAVSSTTSPRFRRGSSGISPVGAGSLGLTAGFSINVSGGSVASRERNAETPRGEGRRSALTPTPAPDDGSGTASSRRFLRRPSPSANTARDAGPVRPRVRYTDSEAGDKGVEENGADRGRRWSMFFLDPRQLLQDMKDKLGVKPDEEAKTDEADEKPTPTQKSRTLKTPGNSATAPSGRPGKGDNDNEYIQVAVRIRPMLERNRGDKDVLSIDWEEGTITLDTKPVTRPPLAPGLQITDSPLLANRDGRETVSRTYKFDHILDSRGAEGDSTCASQESVYEKIGQRIVNSALEGYNACLFAYGQTGTGKTHTMLGNQWPAEKRGLLPRILEGLFQEVGKRKTGESDQAEPREASVQISYLEIFNEQIHDLLVPPKAGCKDSLQVRYHPTLGVMINDLTQPSCSSLEEAMELVEFGTGMRSIASTSMNSRSSRAHTVFTFRFEQTSRDGETQMAQVQIVDLAGREQEKSSSDDRERLKERQFINTSLFHLSTCILHLSSRGSKARAAGPGEFAFRNSRLTLLLAHSLSGNSRTGMIAAVSPAASDMDETLSTLRFADAVKKIRTTVSSNRVNRNTLVRDLQEEIARLKNEMQRRASQPSDLTEQVQQLEAVCHHFKDALEQERNRSKMLAAERAACLEEMGLSVKAESVSLVVGGGQEGQVPYLVNLSEDPYLQGCLMYFLKGPDEVTVGSADGNKIRLNGLGIKAHHCAISNEGNQRLFVRAVAPGAGEDSKDWPRVFLNGRRVTGSVMMKHQDRLILGHACAFRVAVPLIASELRDNRRLGEAGGQNDSKAELGQALAEIEDSSSKEFQHLRKYAEDLEQCVGPDAASAFVRAVHRSVPLVDEANQITRELNRENLVFALQVLTDLWSSQTGAPEFVVAVLQTARASPSGSPTVGLREDVPAVSSRSNGLWQGGQQGNATVKYVWSLEKFKDRLEAMRDIYEELDRSGLAAVHERLDAEPYLDPWKEISAGEVQVMLDGLYTGKINPNILASRLSSVAATDSRRMSANSVGLAGAKMSLDLKSDELLARSQFLIDGASELLRQSPTENNHEGASEPQSTGSEDSVLEQLEQEVQERMGKIGQWYNIGRRASATAFESPVPSSAGPRSPGAVSRGDSEWEGCPGRMWSFAGDGDEEEGHDEEWLYRGSASMKPSRAGPAETQRRNLGRRLMPPASFRAVAAAAERSPSTSSHDVFLTGGLESRLELMTAGLRCENMRLQRQVEELCGQDAVPSIQQLRERELKLHKLALQLEQKEQTLKEIERVAMRLLQRAKGAGLSRRQAESQPAGQSAKAVPAVKGVVSQRNDSAGTSGVSNEDARFTRLRVSNPTKG